MSYRDLDESSKQLALSLIDQGFQPGDRIAIHWSNSIEAVQIFFAVFKAGLIAVPVNLRLKSPEIAWILEHSKPVLCFSEPALAPIGSRPVQAVQLREVFSRNCRHVQPEILIRSPQSTRINPQPFYIRPEAPHGRSAQRIHIEHWSTQPSCLPKAC